MTSIRKSIFFSSISRYTVNILAIISIIVTARLLTPEELGIFGIASAVILFAAEFKSLGAGTYLIRQKELTDENIMKATGLMSIISWGMGAAIFSASNAIGDFYQIEDISNLLKLLSFSFVLAPFISVPKSVFARNFEFKKLLIINISTQVTLVAMTIVFILYGHSYFSLAYAAILSNVVDFLLVFFYKGRSMPMLPSFKGLSVIAKFGILITLANVFKRLSLTSTDLVIGKQGTTTDVAIFSRSLGFLEFLSSTIYRGVNPVVLPYLSNQIRQGKSIQNTYLKATALLGSIVWPALIIAGLAGYPMIIFLFGNQWEESVPIAKILCIWAFFRSIHALSEHLLIATENETHLLIREFFVFCFTLTGILLSYPYGLEAIAWSLTVVSIFNFIYTSILLKTILGIQYQPLLKKVLPVFFLVITLGLLTFFIDLIIDFNTTMPITSLLILLPILFLAWLLGVKLLELDIYQEILKIFNHIKQIIIN